MSKTRSTDSVIREMRWAAKMVERGAAARIIIGRLINVIGHWNASDEARDKLVAGVRLCGRAGGDFRDDIERLIYQTFEEREKARKTWCSLDGFDGIQREEGWNLPGLSGEQALTIRAASGTIHE